MYKCQQIKPSYNLYMKQMKIDSACLLKPAGHVSTFSPNKLSDLLKPKQVPSQTLYFVVGSCTPSLLCRSNPWQLLYKYIKLSRKQNTIFDVCLPYFSQTLRKLYLGRYIIFRGNLCGVRLNCENRNKVYEKWNRTKTRSIKQTLPKNVLKLWQSLNTKQHINAQFLVGQFNLALNNVRIGLMFSEQVQTFTQEYLSYQFQLTSIVQTEDRRKQAKYRSYLSKLQVFSIVIQVPLGSSQNIKFCQNFTKLLSSSVPANQVETRFYDLQELIKAKQYNCEVIQTELSEIQQIQINLSFCTKNKSKRISNLIKNQEVQKNENIYQTKFQFDGRLNNTPIEFIHMQKYLKRLYKVLIFSQSSKIIVPLIQNIKTINILVIVRSFYRYIYGQIPQDQISRLILSKFQFINKGQSKINQIVQSNIVSLFQSDQGVCSQLKQLVEHYRLFQNNNQNQFTIIIHPDQNQVEIIKFLNNINQLQYQKGDAKYVQEISLDSDLQDKLVSPGIPLFKNQAIKQKNKIPQRRLKTFVAIDFFNDEESQLLSHYKEVQQCIDNQKYYEYLCEKSSKVKNNKLLQTKQSQKLGVNYQSSQNSYKMQIYSKNLSQSSANQNILSQQNGFLFLQFEKFKLSIYNTFKNKNDQFPRTYQTFQQYLFAHYYLRNLQSQKLFKNTQSRQSLNCFCLIQELLVNSKKYYLDIIKMVNGKNIDLSKAVHYKDIISKISIMQNQHNYRQECHLCEVKFSKDLMFQCQSSGCQIRLCFKCLKQNNYGQQFYQKIKGKKIQQKLSEKQGCAINKYKQLCLVCKNTCQCKKCQDTHYSQIIKQKICHYCGEYSVNHLVCKQTQCACLFCIRCCIQLFNQQNFKQKDQWTCYICQDRCKCHKCRKFKNISTKKQVINIFEDLQKYDILQMEWKEQESREKQQKQNGNAYRNYQIDEQKNQTINKQQNIQEIKQKEKSSMQIEQTDDPEQIINEEIVQ